MVYGRLIEEGDSAIASRRQRFREVSCTWHRFLSFQPSQQQQQQQPSGKRGRLLYEEEIEEQQLQRWKRLRSVDLQLQLEKLFGPGAQFKGLQEAALRAILRNESPILVVMGTGVGKSLLFMLPALIASKDSGTTIVIVPLTALQSSLQQRCQRAGIPSVIWDSGRPSQVAPLILVTPESALTKGFGTLLDRLQGLRQLDRIVFDECHTVLDAHAGFRPKLLQLSQLVKRAVPLLYLTATLAPSDEPELF